MFDGLFIVDDILYDKQSSEVFIVYKRGVLLGFLIIISFFLAFIIGFGLVEKEKSDAALGISITVIVLLVIAVVYFIFVHKVRNDHSAKEILARRKAKELKMEGLEFWLFVLLAFLSIFGVITTGIVKYFEGNQEWIDAISIFTVCVAVILFLYVIMHLTKGDKKMGLSTDEIRGFRKLKQYIEENPDLTQEEKMNYLTDQIYGQGAEIDDTIEKDPSTRETELDSYQKEIDKNNRRVKAAWNLIDTEREEALEGAKESLNKKENPELRSLLNQVGGKPTESEVKRLRALTEQNEVKSLDQITEEFRNKIDENNRKVKKSWENEDQKRKELFEEAKRRSASNPRIKNFVSSIERRPRDFTETGSVKITASEEAYLNELLEKN